MLRTWLSLGALVAAATGGALLLRRRCERTDRGRRFFRHPTSTTGVALLTFFVLVAVGAPLVAPYDPAAQPDPVGLQNRPPSWLHPLGTDLYSHDLLSRVVFGARVSLGVGTLAMLVALTLGAVVGALAGYLGRWVDGVLMRIVDVGIAVPRMFLLLMAVALWSRLPLGTLIVLIGVTGWFGTSRLVRAEVLSLRERPFVDAARALGARSGRVIFGHVLPNAAAPLIVSAALGIGHVMLLEAALSFLGIGVRPPVASWGNMIADGRDLPTIAPWISLVPGVGIPAVVMSRSAVVCHEPMALCSPVLTLGGLITESAVVQQGLSRGAAPARASDKLRVVGTPDPETRVDDYPHQLSGGMRQRVVIAMALVCRPQILIADEPTTALDVTIQAQILELLERLQAELGMAVMLITHDLGVVAGTADRVVVMYAGQVVETAATPELFASPRHPYTEGLMASIPRLDRPADRLYSIPGTVPAATEWPAGCRFHPRCPYGWGKW